MADLNPLDPKDRKPSPRRLQAGLMLLACLVSFAVFGPRQAQAQGTRATEIERGRYLVKAGDCAACHTVKGGATLAGGFPLATPFGTIYAPNITPDRDTGIGKWSKDDFYRAMHFGTRPDGKSLYPAFPFPWYTKLSRSDVDAIKTYLDTVAPVHLENRQNKLFWPLNWRFFATAWKTLFFHAGEYQPNPQKSAEWNRGAYLMDGPGHCAACHTAKNLLGATESGKDLLGGDAGDSWYAPSLSRDLRDGIGGWSTQEIVEYLKTGANGKSATAGPMTDVIMESTQYMSDPDLRAMAVYMQDLPHDTAPKNRAAANSAAAPASADMARGRALYVDNCIGCHMVNGEGQGGTFPPLKASGAIQAAKADTVIQVILAGAKMADPQSKPTGLRMPAYAWKFNDAEVADLTNYIRNNWGNQAPPVSVGAVASVRKNVVKNSGGHDGMINSPY